MTLMSKSEYISQYHRSDQEHMMDVLTRPSVRLADTGGLKPIIILLNSDGGTDREVSDCM